MITGARARARTHTHTVRAIPIARRNLLYFLLRIQWAINGINFKLKNGVSNIFFVSIIRVDMMNQPDDGNGGVL
jgi:hypothetical protein